VQRNAHVRVLAQLHVLGLQRTCRAVAQLLKVSRFDRLFFRTKTVNVTASDQVSERARAQGLADEAAEDGDFEVCPPPCNICSAAKV
jgi:homoaconitase/3-isopropylmalate dehydratase large subunit